MLRFLLVVIPLFWGCSQDRPLPVAPDPAKKANCALCDFLGSGSHQAQDGQGGHDTPSDSTQTNNTQTDNTQTDNTQTDNTQTPSDSGEFDIEIVFPVPSQFSYSERIKILQAAERWEEVIVGDMPDYIEPVGFTEEVRPFPDSGDPSTVITVPAGERIDDLRIYVVTGETNYDPSWSAWSDANAAYWRLHPETELPAIARVVYKPTDLWWEPVEEYVGESFLTIAIHEIGHALGIGVGPRWDQYIKPGKMAYSQLQQGRMGSNFFTGPAAIAALKRQPRHLDHFWTSGKEARTGNPNALSRIVGTFDEPGTMAQLYAYPGGEYYIGEGVPVTSNNWHWENLLAHEYMGRRSWNPLFKHDMSEVSVGALEDMGYTVDYGPTDILPLNLSFARFLDYLSPDYIEQFLHCTPLGEFLELPCDDSARYEEGKARWE